MSKFLDMQYDEDVVEDERQNQYDYELKNGILIRCILCSLPHENACGEDGGNNCSECSARMCNMCSHNNGECECCYETFCSRACFDKNQKVCKKCDRPRCVKCFGPDPASWNKEGYDGETCRKCVDPNWADDLYDNEFYREYC